MNLNFNKAQGFEVPETLYTLINHILSEQSPPNEKTTAITINFRDPHYSVEKGGYHPVEIRLEKRSELWQLTYITDFSYQGTGFPELIKEIDVCFVTKQMFNLFLGYLQGKQANELLTLFIENFVNYAQNNIYNVEVTFD